MNIIYNYFILFNFFEFKFLRFIKFNCFLNLNNFSQWIGGFLSNMKYMHTVLVVGHSVSYSIFQHSINMIEGEKENGEE